MIISEGKKKWKKYDESFWTPPPLEGSPPKKAPHQGGPQSPATSWDEASYLTKCPSCHQQFQLRGKALLRKLLTCPNCGKKQRGRDFKEIQLVEGQRIEYRRFAKLLSYRGRVGRLEYWLFFLIPGAICWGIEPPLGFFWMLLPGMPTAVKRLQDLGNSGQWMWVPMIHLLLVLGAEGSATTDPATGLIYLLLWLGSIALGIMMAFLKGKSESNRYGPPVEHTEQVWR